MEEQIVVGADAPSLSLLDLLISGGPLMIPIFLLSLITISIVVERWLYLRAATKRNKEMLQRLVALLRQGDVASARLLAEQDKSASGKVMFATMEYIGRPFREIESLMESSAQIEIGKLEHKLGYLGIIAGVAPMLGFIGTISGIIKIFFQISQSNDISIGIISAGLYEKMVSSGAGLVVGVIAYASYHILQQWVQRYSLQLQADALEFFKNLTARPS